jgi:hypothetical protein
MAQQGLPKPGLNQQHLDWYLELALLASLGNVKFRLRDPDLILGSDIYIIYNNPTKLGGKGASTIICSIKPWWSFYSHHKQLAQPIVISNTFCGSVQKVSSKPFFSFFSP